MSTEKGVAVEINGIDDDALFSEMLSGDEGSEKPVVETEQGKEQETQAGEAGAQAATVPAEGGKAPEANSGAQPANEQHTVPVATLIEERRQNGERIAVLEAQLNELRNGKAEPKPLPEPEALPDPVLDPEAYADAVARRVSLTYISRDMEMQAEIAMLKHTPELTNEACEAFVKAKDSGALPQPIVEAIVNASNRFDAAVKWYKSEKQRQALAEIGDPTQFEAKLKEKLLADPEFIKQAIEKSGNVNKVVDATAQPGTKTASLPSVSKIGASAPMAASAALSADDEDLFNESFKGR